MRSRFQREPNIWVSGEPRGPEPKEKVREQGQAQSESKHTPIQGDILQTRHAGRTERDNGVAVEQLHLKGCVVVGDLARALGQERRRGHVAGQVLEVAADTHLPENLSDQPFEVIQVELKAEPGKSRQPKKR